MYQKPNLNRGRDIPSVGSGVTSARAAITPSAAFMGTSRDLQKKEDEEFERLRKRNALLQAKISLEQNQKTLDRLEAEKRKAILARGGQNYY